MRQTLSKAKLPSLQLAVWSKPPLFMAQSSRFTKTTPRFPLADLRIPAAQPLSIQSSGPGRGAAGGAGEGSPQMSGDPSPRQSCPAASGLTRSGLGYRTWGRRFQAGPPNNTQNKSPGSHVLAVRAPATPSRPESKRAGEKTLEADPTLTG